MTDQLWFLGRATGITALVMFTLVVVLGITVRSGRPFLGMPRFAVAAVHRRLSVSALLFLALHIGTLFLDPEAQLRLADLAVPFLAHYRPIWLGLGTVATELVVVLVLSSAMRTWLGPRTWRIVHGTAYLCWPLAVVHAVGSGTDRSSRWMLIVVAGCVTAVVLAAAWRAAGRSFISERAPRRVVAPPPGLSGVSR